MQYSSGHTVTIPITSTSPYLPKADAYPTISTTGTGPRTDRQEASHPHQVYFASSNELLVPDLGADKTWRLARGSDGKWTNVGAIEYKPGSGPRHVLVHGNSPLSPSLALPTEPQMVSSTPFWNSLPSCLPTPFLLSPNNPNTSAHTQHSPYPLHQTCSVLKLLSHPQTAQKAPEYTSQTATTRTQAATPSQSSLLLLPQHP
jgi:hypothetical protein